MWSEGELLVQRLLGHEQKIKSWKSAAMADIVSFRKLLPSANPDKLGF